ncbi:MAG: AIM24 family protein [Thermoplasmata archaeon]|jgi:uncharacterized protein (AIM24 family)
MDVQIQGEFIPIALVSLGAGEQIFCEGGLMVYSDPSVGFQFRWFTQGGMGSVMKRTILGGVPFHLHEFLGPGYVAFSRYRPGEVRRLDLAAGETVDVAEHSMLLATQTVGYNTFYVPGTGRVGRLIGFWMDRLTGPGTIVFQGHGNIITFVLKPGETMDVDHGALLFKDASVNVRAYNQPMGSGLMGHAMSFEALHVEGPGRIWLQTVDPSHHPPRTE